MKTTKKKKSIQVELNKRAAAGGARSTWGRDRIVSPNQRAYDRKRGKGVPQD